MTHRRPMAAALLSLPVAAFALVVHTWFFGTCEVDCWDEQLGLPAFATVLLLPCWLVAAFLFVRPKRELRWLAGALVAVYAVYACVLGFGGGEPGPASVVGLAAVANAFVWRRLGALNAEGPPDGGPSGEAGASGSG